MTKKDTSGEENMKILLAKALKNRFGMTKEDASALTKTVESIFKGKQEVEDMSIDKYVRSLFYELQREKLLKVRREEFKEKGKQIRKYYWSFDDEAIREVAYKKEKSEPYTIYKKIPIEAWLIRLNSN